MQVDLPPWAWVSSWQSASHFTVLVGIGLMALIFYSSRMG
jgi:hypothetical protein